MSIEPIAVYLTPLDQAQFIAFQKNYELFSILQEEGVFDIEFGKVIINIAHKNIQNVIKEVVIYKR